MKCSKQWLLAIFSWPIHLTEQNYCVRYKCFTSKCDLVFVDRLWFTALYSVSNLGECNIWECSVSNIVDFTKCSNKTKWLIQWLKWCHEIGKVEYNLPNIKHLSKTQNKILKNGIEKFSFQNYKLAKNHNVCWNQISPFKYVESKTALRDVWNFEAGIIGWMIM